MRRAAWLVVVALGAALFWVAPRPPMGDLPQHAAQVTMMRDLARGGGPFSDLVELNLRTPYLVGFFVATALSFVMPVIVALKLVLSGAFVAFAAAAVSLRKELEGDERLDWLFLPGFFGLAFQYGFFPFLFAAPIGLVFLRAAHRCARSPSLRASAIVVALGLLLFFAHGLVFAFSVAVALAMTAARADRKDVARAIAPYVALGTVAVAAFVDARLHHPLLAHGGARVDWEWDKPGGWHRTFAFIAYVVASTPHDLTFVPIVLLMLAAPFALRSGLARDRAALAPLAVIAAMWAFSPGEIAKTTYLYERFAIFFLPAYALAFRAAPRPRVPSRLVEVALAAACVIFFGGLAVRERRFVREAAPFEAVLAAAEPNARALEIAIDPASDAVKHAWAYHAYASWYQVERGGFVDFNFAALVPESVRFRPGKEPAMSADADITTREFRALDLGPYRYVFVRHTSAIPEGTLGACTKLVRHEAEWSLYECHPSSRVVTER